FHEMFTIKNISPDDASQLDNLPDIEMPNVVGQTVATACANLKAMGLNVNVDGLGGYVVSQLPLANAILYEGEEVLIYTSD
ncbi:MAG: PASTA domain-containing protein, partial [Clostridia bacterium]|nr:PASTA domain-containing protein [Clostridia bacterium]